jgi:hypothetical protein
VNISDYTAKAATFDIHRPDRLMDALVHGLAAECAEVLEAVQAGEEDPLLLELGDVQWELSQIASCLTMDVPDLAMMENGRGPSSPSLVPLAIDLCIHAGKVSGQLEKWYRVNPPTLVWNRTRNQVLETWCRWAWLVRCAGFTPEQVRESNIEKLSARYGKEAA